jgi:glutamate transport system permease protein
MLQLFTAGAIIYILVNFVLSRVAIWLERRGTKKAAGGVAHADPGGMEAHETEENKT